MDIRYEQPDHASLRKSHFLCDMHYHTRHSHDCKTPVHEIIKRARKLDIHVAFTDHNVIGGVLEALKHKDAPVIPGIELCSREGKEVIAYFPDAGQLADWYGRMVAPRIKRKNALRSSRTPIAMAELLVSLGEEDCVVHLPHPFVPAQRHSYRFFRRRPELLRHVHTIEGFNRALTRRENLAAVGWAISLKKGVAGGSDGHILSWLGGGVTTSTATTIEEHLAAMRAHRTGFVGLEMKNRERVRWPYDIMKVKLGKGVRGAFQKISGVVVKE